MTIKEVIAKIKAQEAEGRITLYDGAKDSMIDKVEEKIAVKLPDDVRTFYRFSNGMEAEEDIFRIIPLNEIMDQRTHGHENMFDIAEYMIYSDMWVMRVNPNDQNDYRIINFDKDGTQLVLTSSFAEFLERWLEGGVFDNGGLYDWHDEIRSKKKK